MGPAIGFTLGARAPTGTLLEAHCSRVAAVDEQGALEETAAGECSAMLGGGNDDVGAACTTAVPDTGFDVRERSVQPSEECATGACLVYQLDGDPSPDCTPSDTHTCPSAEETARSVYCSCRCSAPPGDPGALCACPDGFTCDDDVLPDGPDGLRGGYCVRDESLP